GFAGGLNPAFGCGTVVFSTRDETLERALSKTGAVAGQFHFSSRVATTSEEKRQIRNQTRADVVDMESEIICRVALEHGVRCAAVRVILDPENQDLPLDFNAVMTPDQKMDNLKLTLALAKSPRKLSAMIRFGKQVTEASERLGEVLTSAIREIRH